MMIIKKFIFVLLLVQSLALVSSEAMSHPLLHAAFNGNLNYIQNYEGNINEVVDSEGRSALLLAVCNEQRGAIRVLVRLGANLNHVLKDGTSILDEAFSKPSIFDILREEFDAKSASEMSREEREQRLQNTLYLIKQQDYLRGSHD